MNLLLAGVNHQTAGVDLREKLCTLLPEAEVSYPLLLSYPEIREVLFYTTCNRVEVLCVTEAEAEAMSVLSAFFTRHPEVTPAPFTFTGTRRRCATFSGWPPAWTPWWWGSPRF
jgi:glutamyl-tRNA reductase